MNFLKLAKLKIILTIPLFVVGVLATFAFATATSIGIDSTITSVLLSGGIVDTFLELLSVGGIVGLVLGNFLATFTPVGVLMAIAGIMQLIWSYFLSCLFVFLGKKLFLQAK